MPTPRGTARAVRQRIEAGGDQIWRLTDFEGMPFTAVAQILSRLTKLGILQRLGKGLYYRPRETVFGPSRPSGARIRALNLPGKKVFPAGIAAANLLGFTTQNSGRIEVATEGMSLPRSIIGRETIIHTRRPPAWRDLSETDAAILDFLRNRGAMTELSAEDTVSKLLEHFRKPGRFEQLLAVASTEPPRVRAILGAIAQQLGKPPDVLTKLRKTLNSLSRFDFGALTSLSFARKWQAKEKKLG